MTRSQLVALVVVSLSFCATPAIAQDRECSDMPTAQQVQCLGDALRKEDAKLNRVYRQKLEYLRQEETRRAQLLIEAQRAWISYRDKKCSFEASESAGGSLEKVISLDCHLNMTRERSKELEEIPTPAP